MWLYSWDAVEKIKSIKEILFKNQIEEINSKLGTNYINMSPFMFSRQKYEELHKFNLFNLFPIGNFTKVEKNFNNLLKVEKVYTNFTTLDYLTNFINKSINLANYNIDLLNKFENILNKSIEVIKLIDEIIYKFIIENIYYIFLISNEKDKYFEMNFSSHKCLGSVFMTLKQNNLKFQLIDFIISLVHEMGHQIIYYYQSLDKIIENPNECYAYSGIRKENRPGIRAFHAASVIFYINKFLAKIIYCDYFTLEEKDYINKKLIMYKGNLTLSIKSIEQNCRFTDFGEVIFNEIKFSL